MRSHHARWLLPATLAWACATAAAQASPTPPSARPAADPIDATATVSPLVYRSALTAYRRFADNEPVPWREANDRVGRIGGWRAYAREASAPEVPPSTTPPSKPAADAAPVPMVKPMPGPHGSHKTH